MRDVLISRCGWSCLVTIGNQGGELNTFPLPDRHEMKSSSNRESKRTVAAYASERALQRRRRRLLETTDTLESDMAALASMGESSQPVSG
jgi:hypothetical protein